MEQREIALKNIVLSRSAYFWHVNSGGNRIDESKLASLVISVAVNNSMTDDNPLLLHVRQPGYNNAALFSVIIFRRLRNPAFLKNADGHLDTLHCLIVLVEYQGFVGWTSRNVSGFDSALKDYAYPLPAVVFNRVASQQQGNVRQYSARSLDRKKSGVSSKSISGTHLEYTSSPFENRNYAVSGYHIAEEDASKGIRITTGTSGAAEGGSCSFEEFVAFVVGFVDGVVKSERMSRSSDDDGVKNPFIKSFAKPMELTESFIKESAISISYIKDELEELLFNGEAELFKQRRRGRAEPAELADIEKVVGGTFPLLNQTNGKYLVGSVLRNREVHEYDGKMVVQIKSRKIDIKLPELSKFFIRNRTDGSEISIETFIKDRQQFVVYFGDGKHVFLYGQLYELGGIFDHHEALLQIIITRAEVASAKDEKGELEPGHTSFPDTSLFGFVERCLSVEHECSYLLCDDLGEEYADFIGGNSEHLYFYHCKYDGGRKKNNMPGISGSKFAEIASQVTKNLTFMYMNEVEFAKKVQKNNSQYILNRVKTKIPRIKGPAFMAGEQGVIGEYQKFCSHPHSDTNRHAYMIVDFLSKSELEKEIKRATQPNSRKPPELIQLMWQLNNVVSVCKAQKVNFYLICQP